MRQLLLYIFILFVCTASADQFKITGKVVDAENNEPLICAGIEDVVSRRGVATDIDGNFSIEVEKGVTLKIDSLIAIARIRLKKKWAVGEPPMLFF